MNEPSKEFLAEKRAAMDRVLAAALAERTDMISLYDCAIWLLYACFRSDAISTVKDFEEDDPEASEHTVSDEIEDQIDCAYDDYETASCYQRDAFAVGKQLDPDFEKPARELTDWLDKPKK